MTQVSNKKYTLFENYREGVESRLGEAIRGLHRTQEKLYGILCSREGLLGEGPTSTNLRNSRQYHTIVESRYS